MLRVYHVHYGNIATNQPGIIISLFCCNPIIIIPSLFFLLNLPFMVPLFLFFVISTFQHFISSFLAYCLFQIILSYCFLNIIFSIMPPFPLGLSLLFLHNVTHSPSSVMHCPFLQFFLSSIHFFVILSSQSKISCQWLIQIFFRTTTFLRDPLTVLVVPILWSRFKKYFNIVYTRIFLLKNIRMSAPSGSKFMY